MVERQLATTNTSVKGKFNRITKQQAFCEYIWNALDSGATEIDIRIRSDKELDQITDIEISDNGSGIEIIGEKSPFDNFEDSSKKHSKDPLIRGKYGKGRLSFFKFCKSATWSSRSCYSKNVYVISITDGALDKFSINKTYESEHLKFQTGTSVIFNEVNITIQEFNDCFVPYIQNNVNWINKIKLNLSLKINGTDVCTPKQLSETITNQNILNDNFEVTTIAWESALRIEGEHIYYCDLSGNVISKRKYNSKNKFSCSCIIKSDWFSPFHSNSNDQLTPTLDFKSEKFLAIENFAYSSLDQLYQSLRHNAIDELFDEYEREGLFSFCRTNTRLARFKSEQLKDAIKVIYNADSTVFTELKNKKQKTILIKLIDRIVNSDDPDSLFNVLEGVISISDSDMRTLSNSLEKVKMTNIIKTIKQLEDRLTILDLFESLLANKQDTYEVAHIQKVVESNMWLFGEEYNVLTTEEEKFDKALRKYLKFKDENIGLKDDAEQEIYHPKHYDKYSVNNIHKNKEMDIFASQKAVTYHDGKSFFKNIVVELKRPSVNLTDNELQQIKNYMNVIKNEDSFDTHNDHWDFILVGNKISKNPQKTFGIETELISNKNHGKPGLLLEVGNMRIWIKEWSQIIGDFKLRYSHIIDSLNRKYNEVSETDPNLVTIEIGKLSNL